MSKIRKVPKGYHSVTPCLVVKEGLKAVEYYKKVFGAKDQGLMMTPDGKSVAHAELEIGDSKIMLCDEFPQISVLLHLLLEVLPFHYTCTLKMWIKHLTWP